MAGLFDRISLYLLCHTQRCPMLDLGNPIQCTVGLHQLVSIKSVEWQYIANDLCGTRCLGAIFMADQKKQNYPPCIALLTQPVDIISICGSHLFHRLGAIYEVDPGRFSYAGCCTDCIFCDRHDHADQTTDRKLDILDRHQPGLYTSFHHSGWAFIRLIVFNLFCAVHQRLEGMATVAASQCFLMKVPGLPHQYHWNLHLYTVFYILIFK